MKNVILALFALPTAILAQANFSGNIYDAEKKVALTNAKILAITAKDSVVILPDKNGKFNFKTNPGRTRLVVVADGYVSELNSINAGDKTDNIVSFELTKSTVLDKAELAKSKLAPSKIVHSETPSSSGMYTSDYDVSYKAIKAIKPAENATLTAGEINDFAKWNFWSGRDFSELTRVSSGNFNFNYTYRFCIQLKLPNGMPIIDAQVELFNAISSEPIWVSKSDNTGKVEMFSSLPPGINAYDYKVKIVSNGQENTFGAIYPFENGINVITIDMPCTVADQLDIAFLIDATGSMGDEINYLKHDIDTMVEQITNDYKHINIRMASVFYRDLKDEYIIKTSAFSSNTQLTAGFIAEQQADGGGDYPEALDSGLHVAINKLNWSNQARARILFVFLDAPSHNTNNENKKLQELAAEAARLGIRIVPVACSGSSKDVEYIMRNLALATNGTYTFLTNHSGIGSTHIEPTTDGYKVESLRNILVRIGLQFSITPDCDKFIDPVQLQNIDTTRTVENPLGKADTTYSNKPINDSSNTAKPYSFVCYPNPSNGIVNIKYSSAITQAFLADMNGKLLQQITINNEGLSKIDLSKYANGIYLIQYYNGIKWQSSKIVYVVNL